MRAVLWLFDLDNTLHDASHAAFGPISVAMTDYIMRHLQVTEPQAQALRKNYWQQYGATLLGLIRHHSIDPHHFLKETHHLPDLETKLRTSASDRLALRCLPGRKVILTNAPRQYALRVLKNLRLKHHFEAIISVENMRMWGHWRPKPDTRMLRYVAARLQVPTSRCVLVEDTLAHQRAAHRVGMGTVWMQRYSAGAKHGMKPRYVDLKINALKQLHRSTKNF